jgi:hypothetical protein
LVAFLELDRDAGLPLAGEQFWHEARGQSQKAPNHDLAMKRIAEGLCTLRKIARMIE